MPKENLAFTRPESPSVDCREPYQKRRCQSQLSNDEHARSPSQHTLLPSLTAYCSHCKLPLLIDVSAREMSTKSRASTTRKSQRLCNECTGGKVKNDRIPSSRLYKSASVDWTNVGDKIETWFEKARTPDQRVVYNFLEQIHGDQEKEFERTIDSSQGKNLDDILTNLKKYRTRFNSSRPSQKKLNRVFESTTWRVMRNPTTPRQFSRYNSVYGDDASRDFRIGTVFTTTEPRIGSTFLLHPNWV